MEREILRLEQEIGNVLVDKYLVMFLRCKGVGVREALNRYQSPVVRLKAFNAGLVGTFEAVVPPGGK